ncbi:PREDICTED: uncharacterized protein LOC108557082 [Nicrophorus vespilloides]|uniref:Uncharacterized protein LOC108557082 n=1 Tax=Nicrophorus vespilloides TaxID=110193 RepID=A0ABM1M304_NICVS|nr:PREDICTED: uncharacterized protein LOC108557082 [Nicrophorus vespilloides]
MENCKSSWNLFKFANEHNMLRLFQRYLLIINEVEFSDFLEEIKMYNLFVNNEVWIARRSLTDYKLYSPYKIKNDTEMILEYGGRWSEKSGWNRMELLPTSTRRKDLKFLPFKFGIVLDDLNTLNHLYDFRYPEIDLFSKQTIGPVSTLFDYCNMSVTLVRTNTYGYYIKETDSWNGLIGQIMTGEFNVFIGSSMVFSTNRLSVVDFLTMLNPLEVIFVYRKAPLSNVKNIFFVSFKKQLWYALFGLLAILGIGFYLVLKFAELVKDKYTVSDAVLLDLEMLCQQGTMFEPRSLSYQILMFFGLTALMTTKKFDSIQDLYNSRFKVIAHNTSYMKFILSGTRDKFLNQFYELKIGYDSPFVSKENCVEKLRQGGTAIFGEVLILYNLATKYYTERELCSLQEMIGFVKTGIGYNPLPKGTPFRKMFRIA